MLKDNLSAVHWTVASVESGQPSVPSRETAPIVWIRKHSLALFFALLLLGSARIIATYTVFNATWDEPDHIAAGTEWLNDGHMQLDFSHPPLARVAAALGPWLASGRAPVPPDYQGDPATVRTWLGPSLAGLSVLYRDGASDRNLALARLGILPFFWLACLSVYLFARRYLGEPAALFAVFLFSFLPPVLGHAGLATTDMALTAMTGATFLMTLAWVGHPTPARTLLLGGIAGLAVLSKFSALAYIPVALVSAYFVWIAAERPPHPFRVGKYLRPLALALIVCALVVWAGYRFSLGEMTTRGFHLVLPAPEFFQGIRSLFEYNEHGHPAFLLGNHSGSGWWYFFLVVLAVKTPLAFLALAIFGAIATARGNRGVRLALAFSLSILAVSFVSRLDLGVRHILPVYLGFSVVAAAGAQRLLALSAKTKWAGWSLGVLLVWMAAASGLSHPDYLAWFNPLAGSHPEKILIDSDLDWNQDLKRLSMRLQEVKATSVAFSEFGPADLRALGFPPVSTPSWTAPTPGWNAVSLSKLKRYEMEGGPLPWQETIPPNEKIGKGIWLWYFPPTP